MKKRLRLLAWVLSLAMLAGMLCPAAFADDGPFTIYFETGGGTGIPIIASTSSSGKLTTLPEPTMDGYKFEGWFTDELEGDKVTLNTQFGADTTIYARWLPLSGKTSSSSSSSPAQNATISPDFRLKAHAGTLLVAGTMLVMLAVLYG